MGGRIQRPNQALFNARVREYHANSRKLANMDRQIAKLKQDARDRWKHLRQQKTRLLESIAVTKVKSLAEQMTEHRQRERFGLGSDWIAPRSKRDTPDSLPTLERIPTDANVDLSTDDLNWIEDRDETHHKKRDTVSLWSAASSEIATEALV